MSQIYIYVDGIMQEIEFWVTPTNYYYHNNSEVISYEGSRLWPGDMVIVDSIVD